MCRYGYNLAFAAPEGLADGVNAISQDFQQVVYRQQQMGFNAVRSALQEYILCPTFQA